MTQTLSYQFMPATNPYFAIKQRLVVVFLRVLTYTNLLICPYSFHPYLNHPVLFPPLSPLFFLPRLLLRLFDFINELGTTTSKFSHSLFLLFFFAIHSSSNQLNSWRWLPVMISKTDHSRMDHTHSHICTHLMIHIHTHSHTLGRVQTHKHTHSYTSTHT